MYKDKGTMKVFNGKKFKTVSYFKENDSTVVFSTSTTTGKYEDITKEHKVTVLENGEQKKYDVEIISEEKKVDEIFGMMKKNKIVPFFITRKDKVIFKFKI